MLEIVQHQKRALIPKVRFERVQWQLVQRLLDAERLGNGGDYLVRITDRSKVDEVDPLELVQRRPCDLQRKACLAGTPSASKGDEPSGGKELENSLTFFLSADEAGQGGGEVVEGGERPLGEQFLILFVRRPFQQCLDGRMTGGLQECVGLGPGESEYAGDLDQILPVAHPPDLAPGPSVDGVPWEIRLLGESLETPLMVRQVLVQDVGQGSFSCNGPSRNGTCSGPFAEWCVSGDKHMLKSTWGTIEYLLDQQGG